MDGRGIRIDHQKPAGGILKPDQVLKIAGEGMPIKKADLKGDLYLTVNVKFPEDDWLQDEKVTSTLQALLPKPDPLIQADTIDEVEYDADADIEDFGASGGHDGAGWEDEDEEDEHGPQCAQQ